MTNRSRDAVPPQFVEHQGAEYGSSLDRAIYPSRMSKRGYSREFTPRTDRRIKREIDRVPPTLDEKVQAKCKRDGISLRAATLTLWRLWVDGSVSLSESP